MRTPGRTLVGRWALAVAAAMCLAGCSAPAAGPSNAVAPAPPNVGSGGGTTGFTAPSARSSAGSAPEATGAQDAASVSAPVNDRMIVYTTQVSLDVESVPDSVVAVTSLAEGLGGFVSATNTRMERDRQISTLTIRVPAGAYNQAMTQLRSLAVRVTAENGNARDVGEEFADLGVQVRNLEASESQLVGLMAKATTVEEILKVQQQLSTVRGQIERLKGRMQSLQRSADMATITVNLSPSAAARPDTTGWDPGLAFREAWADSVRSLQRFTEGTIRVVVLSWWLVVLGLLVGGVVLAVRRVRPSKPPMAPPAAT